MTRHKGEYVSLGHMIDGWRCSCGWESHPYFDGADYAEGEFKRHLSSSLTEDAHNGKASSAALGSSPIGNE